jgi:plastocyanin
MGAVILFLAVLGLGLLQPVIPSSAGEFRVVIAGGPNEFVPQTHQIRQGDSVAWENQDTVVHLIMMPKPSLKNRETADALEINTDVAPKDGRDNRIDHQFQRPGRYPYFCGRHPDMWGLVVVE